MSYDLLFGAKNGDAPPSEADLAAYFEGRTHYQVDGQEVLYQNDDTGVYFIFYLEHSLDPEEIAELKEAGEVPFPAFASLNINFFRPHVFGLEAAPEIAAFVRHFDLAVDDPQSDDDATGAFSEPRFLRGWNRGNAFAYRAILNHDPDQTLYSLPGDILEASWRWNLERNDLQERLTEAGNDVFVPKVSFLLPPGNSTPMTMAVWPDGISALIPQVELLYISRRVYAPRRFLRRKEDVAVATWDEALPLLETFDQCEASLPYRELYYQDVPPAVAAFISGLPATETESCQLVSADSILSQELLDSARAPSAGSDET